VPVEFRRWVFRHSLQMQRDALFVFGDNLQRWGKGGQAYAMRGEPNAIGLPTKRSPYRYLTDADMPEVLSVTIADVRRLWRHSFEGGLVVWPLRGIGTGRAELVTRAPEVAIYYAAVLGLLERPDQPIGGCAFQHMLHSIVAKAAAEQP